MVFILECYRDGAARRGAATAAGGDRDARRLALDLTDILDIADDQPIRAEAVLVSAGFAGNHRASQGGGLADIDVVAARARIQAALVGHALVVAVHLGGGKVRRGRDGGAVAERWHADARAKACAVLFAARRLGVLEGDDSEVAANIRLDPVRANLGAFEGGIATAMQQQAAGIEGAVDLSNGVTVAIVLGALRTEVEGEAVLLANIEAGADGGFGFRPFAFAVAGVLCALHQHIVFGQQQGVGGFQAAAGDLDITLSTHRCARGDDRQILPCVERALLGGGAVVFAAVLAAVIGQFSADLDQRTVAGRAASFVFEAGALCIGVRCLAVQVVGGERCLGDFDGLEAWVISTTGRFDGVAHAGGGVHYRARDHSPNGQAF